MFWVHFTKIEPDYRGTCREINRAKHRRVEQIIYRYKLFTF